MKNLIVALVLVLAPATARAASFTCETVAGPLNLCIPKVNTDWPSWSSATVNAFRLIGAGAPVNSTGSVHTADLMQTRRISGLSTGTPNIWISSPTIFSQSTAPVASGYVLISSGSALVQSTTSTAGHPILDVSNQAGSSVFRVRQDGDITATGALTASSGSFTATGANIYSVTTSSGIKMAAGCLGFSDGTIQCTKPSATGVASSDNTTWTGTQDWTKAVTFSSAAYGVEGIVVGTAAVSAVTSYTFGSSVVSSSATYWIIYELYQNTSDGIPSIQVSGLTANYRYANKNNCDNTDETQITSTSDSSIRLSRNALVAGQFFSGKAKISQGDYPNGRVHLEFVTSGMGTSVIQCTIAGGGTIAVVPGLSSIKIQTSAGTFTGKLILLRRWDK